VTHLFLGLPAVSSRLEDVEVGPIALTLFWFLKTELRANLRTVLVLVHSSPFFILTIQILLPLWLMSPWHPVTGDAPSIRELNAVLRECRHHYSTPIIASAEEYIALHTGRR
jgi:hypothetical protein